MMKMERNYFKEAYRNLEKQAPNLKGINFDVLNFEIKFDLNFENQ